MLVDYFMSANGHPSRQPCQSPSPPGSPRTPNLSNAGGKHARRRTLHQHDLLRFRCGCRRALARVVACVAGHRRSVRQYKFAHDGAAGAAVGVVH